MTDYVARMQVQLSDEASSNARNVATSLGLIAEAADKATSATVNAATVTKDFGNVAGNTAPALGNVSSGFEELANKIGSYSTYTSAMNTINAAFTQGLAAVRAELAAGNVTVEEAATKEERLTTARDNSTQAARKQSQAVADNFAQQSSATDTATTSTNQLGDSQGKLITQELALYTAISGGKNALLAYIEATAKNAVASDGAASSTGGLGSAFAAILSPVGLATTALLAMGVVAFEVIQRITTLAEQEATLSNAIAATGRSAQTSVAQLQAYGVELQKAGVSAADAQNIENQLARAQGLNQPQQAQVTALAPSLGLALGTSSTDGAKQLITLLTGVSDAGKQAGDSMAATSETIKKLDSALNFLSPDQAAMIAQLIQQGDRTNAVRIATEALIPRLEKMHDPASALDQAFIDLKLSWQGFLDAVSHSEIAVAALDKITGAVTYLANAVKNAQLNDLNTHVSDLEAELSASKGGGVISGVTGYLRNQMSELGVTIPTTGRSTVEIQAELDSVKAKIADLTTPAPPPLPQVSYGPQPSSADMAKNAADAAAQKNLFYTAQTTVEGTKSGQIAKLTEANKQYSASLAEMGPRTEANAARFDTLTGAIAANNDQIANLNKQTPVTLSQYARQIDVLDAQIAEQKALTKAYGEGYEQVQAIIAQATAAKQVAHDGSADAAEQARQLENLTQKQIQLAQTKALADVTKDTRDANAIADAQLRINAAYDGTELSVTHAENAERARAQVLADGITPSNEKFKASVDGLTNAYDRATASSKIFAQQQASVQALAGIMTNAFDTIGNAMIQAFTGGSKSAVNWGNVLHTVMSQIISDVAKLAIINPVVNSLFGTNNATLSSGFQALSGGGSSSGGGFGIGSAVSGISTASGISSAFGGPSIGSALGLTGEGGLFAGFPSIGGGFSGAASYLFGNAASGGEAAAAVPLFTDTAATQGVLGTTGGFTGFLGTPIGASFGSSATIGTALSGVGLGFGAGSLLGGLLAGDSPQRHETATLGAGGGAIAGAAIGSFLGPGGTVIGGLIGGLIGGGGGGLIGPGKQNSFSTESLSLNAQGQFVLSNGIAQKDENARAEFIQAATDQTNLNQFLAANNIRAASLGGITQLGDNTPGGFADPSKSANFGTAFSKFRFTAANDNPSANPEINTALGNVLNGTSFATANDLTTAVAGVQTFLSTTVPALLLVGKTSGSFNDSIKAVNATFNDSITYAHKLGVEEKALTDARDAQLKVVNDAEQKAMNITNSQLDIQFNTALASINNDTKLANQNALASFDLSASSARDTFIKNLTDTYGDAFLTTQKYTDEVTKLDKTTAEQRLALIAQQNQAAIGATTSTISSLTQFAFGLQTGAGSPLNTPDQYSLASNQFDAIAKKAKAGDFTALQQLQGSSNTLLADSQAMFGSGVGFVADFNKVLDVLSSVATQSPDALTASFYAAQTAQATNQVVTALGALQDEVTAVRLAITQSSNQPARLAA